MKKLLATFLFLLLTISPAAAEQPDRIDEIRKGEVLPDTWKLYYQGTNDDFAVFYDIAGREVWFRYRRNKFDDEGINSIRFLVSGILYKIRGEFSGMFLYSDKIVPYFKKAEELSPEMKKSSPAIPVFRLIEYQSLASEDIIF